MGFGLVAGLFYQPKCQYLTIRERDSLILINVHVHFYNMLLFLCQRGKQQSIIIRTKHM